jgi:hypothetical protein
MFAGTLMLCFSLKYETHIALTDVQCQISDKIASVHIKKKKSTAQRNVICAISVHYFSALFRVQPFVAIEYCWFTNQLIWISSFILDCDDTCILENHHIAAETKAFI